MDEVGWREEEAEDSQQALVERRGREIQNGQERIIIPLVDEEEEVRQEEKIIEVIAEVIDLTIGSRNKRRGVLPEVTRNLAIKLPEFCHEQYHYNGMLIRPGITVQIEAQTELYRASFLMVQLIIQSPTGVKLRGLPLTRTRHLRGQLPRQRNEVCLVLKVDADDDRADNAQGAIEVPVESAQGTRDCHLTNADFPAFRFDPTLYRTVAEIEERALLMCRWKVRLLYEDGAARQRGRAPVEFALQHVGEDEVARDRFRVPQIHRLNCWRGGKVRGGAYDPAQPFKQDFVVDLDDDDDHNNYNNNNKSNDNKDDNTNDAADKNDAAAAAAGFSNSSSSSSSPSPQGWIVKSPGQKYTFGDMFCGAGGASLGARKAGFQVRLGCDNHNGACATWRAAFPEATLFDLDVHDFLTRVVDNSDIDDIDNGGRGSGGGGNNNNNHLLRVDVLHLSPPCQFWSPAHTVSGRNDDANIAVMFSCGALVRALRPRLVTLEQTFGILHPKFEWYFNALLRGLTELGYALRWRVANLLGWGLPARRARLVIIGACPGEDLPDFPPPTHADDETRRRRQQQPSGGSAGSSGSRAGSGAGSGSGVAAAGPEAGTGAAERPMPGSGSGSGRPLRPYTSVRQVLAKLRRPRTTRTAASTDPNNPNNNNNDNPGGLGDDPLHQPHLMPRKAAPPEDPDRPLRRCITTNGGYGNHHWTGARDYTLREYACLQTFPPDWPFSPPDVKRQIGNGFPPLVVKHIYRHLRLWLEARDRVWSSSSSSAAAAAAGEQGGGAGGGAGWGGGAGAWEGSPEPLDPDDPDVVLVSSGDDDDDDDDDDVLLLGESSIKAPPKNDDYYSDSDVEITGVQHLNNNKNNNKRHSSSINSINSSSSSRIGIIRSRSRSSETALSSPPPPPPPPEDDMMDIDWSADGSSSAGFCCIDGDQSRAAAAIAEAVATPMSTPPSRGFVDLTRESLVQGKVHVDLTQD
ncbi:S-adenosyl-L-methionine-dependent methyltransferase [Xylariaceae sp. FL0804]|nr:S-adenosyl-L-methionine-dependent methyltransferase [Xylariaceae sp. FL0804]